jgi:hypothetical protein
LPSGVLQAVGAGYILDVNLNQSDRCEDAPTVGFGTFTGCTEQATVDNTAAAPCAPSSTSPDLWWNFVAPSTGSVTISTEGSNFDTVLSVHSACPGTAANAIACNNDIGAGVLQSRVNLNVTQGQFYLVRVAGAAADSGSVNLTISGTVGPCYANCDNSTVAPALNAGDFSCFLTRFRAGCP